MANLNNLIVNGESRFVGGIYGNLTGNVTGNCSGSSGSCTGNAATATTATNSNNSKLTHTVGNTEYPLVFGSSYTTNDSQQVLRIGTPTTTAANCALRAKAYCAAANTQGEGYLVCGNNIALASANNSRGSIYLYGTNTGYSRLLPGNNTTSNITITLPSAGGTLGMMTNANSFWGLTTPAGSASDWIRTTSNGIIPYQSGSAGAGHCGLGTSSWYFATAYIDNIYGKLNGNITGSSASCTGNAASSTYATNIRVTDTDSNTWYPIVLSSGSAASTNYVARVDSDSILAYPGASPAAGTQGNTYLQLGNAKATATAGNKRGRIRIYGVNTSYTELISGVGTTARTITFPDATGTVALTGHTHTEFTPVGTIIFFAKATAPTGYIACNGAAVSRTTYAALYAVIGTTYGTGNGSTTFNLPNLIDKFAMGKSAINKAISAGLPKIEGHITNLFNGVNTWNMAADGAFAVDTTWSGTGANSSGIDQMGNISFSASRSSTIYGSSTTVQPPAVGLLPCIKY